MAAVLALPFVALLASGDPLSYLTYARLLTEDVTDVEAAGHATVSASAFASISMCGYLIGSGRLDRRSRWVPYVLAFVDAWLIGKRAAVAVVLIMVLLAWWQSRGVDRRKLVLGGAIIGVLGILYFWAYQLLFRREQAVAAGYLNYRVDFARDSQMMFGIFAQLPESQLRILDYPGQSLLFTLTSIIPRSFWPEKPYPYAVYFTNALFLRDSDEPLGWGMTTSLFDELVSNLGLWAGLLAGPLVVILACKLIDRIRDRGLRVVGLTILILASVLQVSAFLPMVGVFAALLVVVRAESFREGRELKVNGAEQAAVPRLL